MSSYQHMDHAGWVENNNMAANRLMAKSRSKKKPPPAPEKLTPFQAKVMDILGMVFGGIYNAPINWDSVEWDYGHGVSVTLSSTGRTMATWDFNQLSMLVFLCHEARIRSEIGPGSFRSLRLSFWPRVANGDMSRRHPNLDEAVAAFRTYLPQDHRIIYKEEMVDEGQS